MPASVAAAAALYVGQLGGIDSMWMVMTAIPQSGIPFIDADGRWYVRQLALGQRTRDIRPVCCYKCYDWVMMPPWTVVGGASTSHPSCSS